MTTIIIGLLIIAVVLAFRPRVDRARVDAEIEQQLAELAARGVVPTGDIWKELGE